jgi:hypothetical protein
MEELVEEGTCSEAFEDGKSCVLMELVKCNVLWKETGVESEEE